MHSIAEHVQLKTVGVKKYEHHPQKVKSRLAVRALFLKR